MLNRQKKQQPLDHIGFELDWVNQFISDQAFCSLIARTLKIKKSFLLWKAILCNFRAQIKQRLKSLSYSVTGVLGVKFSVSSC